jgi:hypothetical protein
MLARVASHLKHNVVAYLALFVALGGTSAYAANQFTGADIVNSSLTGADVKDQSIENRDLARNSIGSGMIRDGKVGNADLGPDSVTTDKVAPDALSGDDVQNESLSGDDVQNESLTGADIKDRQLSRADYTSISGVTVTVEGVSAPFNDATPCMPITVDAPGVNVGDIGMVAAVMDSTAPDNMIVANEVQRTAGKLSWRACATQGSFSNWRPKFSLTALR